MKLFISLLIAFVSFNSFSQDTIQETVITKKTVVVNPLPVEIYNHLKTKGTGIEVTTYTSSKTFSLPKNGGTQYFLTFLEGKSTVDFNKENHAYVMILAEDDFYMDAEISISETSSYIVFKKDGQKYYNILNQKGVDFFKKFL